MGIRWILKEITSPTYDEKYQKPLKIISHISNRQFTGTARFGHFYYSSVLKIFLLLLFNKNSVAMIQFICTKIYFLDLVHKKYSSEAKSYILNGMVNIIYALNLVLIINSSTTKAWCSLTKPWCQRKKHKHSYLTTWSPMHLSLFTRLESNQSVKRFSENSLASARYWSWYSRFIS